MQVRNSPSEFVHSISQVPPLEDLWEKFYILQVSCPGRVTLHFLSNDMIHGIAIT